MYRTKTRPVFLVIGAGLLILFFISVFSEKKKPEESVDSSVADVVKAPPATVSQVPAPSVEEHMKPETIVVFPHSSIACLTPEALLLASTRLLKGENTKAEALFMSERNTDAPCLMLDPKRKFKVLSVEYNNPDLPDLGIMEIVGASSGSSSGAWVYTAGALVQ